MKDEEILKIALEMEKKAIQRYREMRENASHETADLLDFLINEEKDHYRVIDEKLKAIKLLRKE